MIERLDITKYRTKHQKQFPEGETNQRLPMPTDAISMVSDPESWNCYPDDVVRICLTKIEDRHVIVIGDRQNPTICQKCFESLDEACIFITHRPEKISRSWLISNGFEFWESSINTSECPKEKEAETSQKAARRKSRLTVKDKDKIMIRWDF